MNDPVSGIPAQRGPESAAPTRRHPIPLAELLTWHRPGVHLVRLADREVWVRMDGSGWPTYRWTERPGFWRPPPDRGPARWTCAVARLSAARAWPRAGICARVVNMVSKQLMSARPVCHRVAGCCCCRPAA